MILSLAVRDLRADWRLAFCLIVGLAAVLAPLLVLLGLKNGVIERVRAELIENPSVRQITNLAVRPFDAEFFTRMAARPEVVFVIPRARSFNSEAIFARAEAEAPARNAEIVPTGPNDPLMRGLPPPRIDEIVPQANFAARIGLSVGQEVVLRVPGASGISPLVLRLRVSSIAPMAATGREAVMVHAHVARLVAAYTDQQLPPTATAEDAAQLPFGTAEGFRLHVRNLSDVPRIDALLRSLDFPVFSRADDVQALFGMDEALTLLFALLAGLGGLGYVVSLGVSLYANVERKQRELSLLRLTGVRRGELALFTVMQAAAIGAAGASLAAGVAVTIQLGLNAWWPLGNPTEPRTPLSAIQPSDLLVAGLCSMAGAAVAALVAGLRAASVEPAKGMRYG